MASRYDFMNAATAEEFEAARQAAIEEIATHPANEHIPDADIDAFAEGQVDKWLEDLGLISRRETLKAKALA